MSLAAFALFVLVGACSPGDGSGAQASAEALSPPPSDASTGDLSDRPEPKEPPDFGVMEQTDPDPAFFVATSEWGITPANQVIALLAPGVTAEDVAAEFGNWVIGRIDYVGLVQLEVPAVNEDELRVLLAEIRAVPEVVAAFPNAELAVTAPCGVFADPAYEGDNGKPYELIGVSRTWDILDALDLERTPVTVGVVDSAMTTDPFGVLPSELDRAAVSNDVEDRTSDYGPHGGYTHADGIVRMSDVEKMRSVQLAL